MAKKKYNIVFISIFVTSFLLALIVTISYKNYFTKVPVVIIRKDIKSLPAYTQLTEDKLDTIQVAKDELNYLDGFYINKKDVLNKYTTTEIAGGALLSKNQVVDLNDMSKEQNGIPKGEYRTIAIPIKPEYSINNNFSAGSIVDLYFISLYKTTDDLVSDDNDTVYIIPVQNLITIKNKIVIDKNVFAVIDVKDTEVEKYLAYLYLANTNKGYFTITLPGVEPTDYKGKAIKIREVIDKNFR